MNRIVIELSADDRHILEGLADAVTLLASVIGNAQPRDVQEKIIAEENGPAPDPAEEHPVDASIIPFDPPAPAPVPVSLGEFQKAIVTRCAESPDTKQKVQALVHKFADSVSAIPEDKRSEVLAALAQI